MQSFCTLPMILHIIVLLTAFTLTSTSVPPLYNGSVPKPVVVADAFYHFDGNTFDLYSRRDGIVVGGSVSYIEGYVGYGKAIVFDQSIPTQINIQPSFNFSVNTSFTIEGFFMLKKSQMNAILIQLTPTVMMNLTNGLLTASLGSDITILGTSIIPTDQWHHLGFVYNVIEQTVAVYLNGYVEATRSSVIPKIYSDHINSTIIIGTGFQGCIDHLSITLQAKSSTTILWDATTLGYYRLDAPWSHDSGPNGHDASGSNVIPIYGWQNQGLKFNQTDAYYEVNRLTALGIPNHSFSIALWIRVETQGGTFLTISNPSTCLLILGFENKTNRLFAYLPTTTKLGASVIMKGPIMPSNVWVHVAFTLSSENRARLYTSAYLQSTDDAVINHNNSLPMKVTLGKYLGPANCRNIEGVDTSQQFMGSLDELLIFGRELTGDDLGELIRF